MLGQILQRILCRIYILHQKKSITIKTLSHLFSPCLDVYLFSIFFTKIDLMGELSTNLISQNEKSKYC